VPDGLTQATWHEAKKLTGSQHSLLHEKVRPGILLPDAVNLILDARYTTVALCHCRSVRHFEL